MDVKGPFPKRMLKKGAFTTKHFESDPGMSFKLYEDDPVTGKPVSAPDTLSCCFCTIKSHPRLTVVSSMLSSPGLLIVKPRTILRT